ncbi:MAG: NADH:flavin oxidoreductase [Polyangiaceae bacterium]
MFIPKERIRHPLPPLSEPTAAQAERSRLFSPLTLKSGLELRTRTWVPAMVPWRATDQGFVTPEVRAWYRRFARGKPGVIVLEATGIRDVPSGPLLRIGHDRFVLGLRELVEDVREASDGETKLFIQIIDFLRIRRRPPRDRFFASFLAIGEHHRARLAELARDASIVSEPEPALRALLAGLSDEALASVLEPREREALDFGERERVTDTHLAHIARLPETLPPLFADAAARAHAAGFDGVELHFAHAYTMASFLSRTNTRADGFGGELAGRVRLPKDVIARVRASVPRGFTVGARMLCDEVFPGGSDVSDACAIAVELAQTGLDFLSLSTGGKFDDAKQPKVGEAAYPYTGPSGYECMPGALSDARGPFARNIGKQARVRRALRDAGLETPVVVAGGIDDFAIAEGILERGEGDLIGAARQSLADPDWFEKLRRGRAREIRRCVYSNYCEGLDQKHRMVTCRLWDRERLDEPGVLTTDGGRRRLIAP